MYLYSFAVKYIVSMVKSAFIFILVKRTLEICEIFATLNESAFSAKCVLNGKRKRNRNMENGVVHHFFF